jgi:hypothetical protein
MIMMIFCMFFCTNLMTTAQEALREIIDVVLHTSEVGIEEIRDHENAMLAPIHLILIPRLLLVLAPTPI